MFAVMVEDVCKWVMHTILTTPQNDKEMSCAIPEPVAAPDPRKEIVKKCVYAFAAMRKRLKCAVVHGVVFTLPVGH